jgi:hypothetical protein
VVLGVVVLAGPPGVADGAGTACCVELDGVACVLAGPVVPGSCFTVGVAVEFWLEPGDCVEVAWAGAGV